MQIKIQKANDERIEFTVDGVPYVITDEIGKGKFRLHLDDLKTISIEPCYTNEVLISGV